MPFTVKQLIPVPPQIETQTASPPKPPSSKDPLNQQIGRVFAVSVPV